MASGVDSGSPGTQPLLFLPMSAVQGPSGKRERPRRRLGSRRGAAGRALPFSIPTVLLNRRLFDRELGAVDGPAGGHRGARRGAGVHHGRRVRPPRLLQQPLDVDRRAVLRRRHVQYRRLRRHRADADLPVGQTVSRCRPSSSVRPVSRSRSLRSVLGPAIQDRITRALGTMTDTQLDLLGGPRARPRLRRPDGTDPRRTHRPRGVRRRHAGLRHGCGWHSSNATSRCSLPTPATRSPSFGPESRRARAVVAATEDDAQDALIILTARELNPGFASSPRRPTRRTSGSSNERAPTR